MQVFNATDMKKMFSISFIVLLTMACKKKVDHVVTYDNVIYEVNTQTIYSSNAQKNKQKSPELIISIMYADIFNQGIPTNELLEIAEIYLATGDKTMFNELIFSHFLKDPSAIVPSDAQMRADIGQFVEDTYIKFYQREPSEYEKHYLINLIEDDANMTVENVYTSIILSNEYFFY